jgi:hypothetical protein
MGEAKKNRRGKSHCGLAGSSRRILSTIHFCSACSLSSDFFVFVSFTISFSGRVCVGGICIPIDFRRLQSGARGRNCKTSRRFLWMNVTERKFYRELFVGRSYWKVISCKFSLGLSFSFRMVQAGSASWHGIPISFRVLLLRCTTLHESSFGVAVHSARLAANVMKIELRSLSRNFNLRKSFLLVWCNRWFKWFRSWMEHHKLQSNLKKGSSGMMESGQVSSSVNVLHLSMRSNCIWTLSRKAFEIINVESLSSFRHGASHPSYVTSSLTFLENPSSL